MKQVEERTYDYVRARVEIAAREAAQLADQGVSLPLHIKPRDFSDEALSRRYELHTKMMALNPQGWPTPPGGKPAHRKMPRKRPGVACGWAARLGTEIARRAQYGNPEV